MYNFKINWHLIAYVMLALAIIVAFAQDRSHYNIEKHNQKVETQKIFKTLKEDTQASLVQGCRRGNLLRVSLSNIVLGSIPEVQSQEDKHLISAEQAQSSIQQLKAIAKQIAPIDCESTTVNLNGQS